MERYCKKSIIQKQLMTKLTIGSSKPINVHELRINDYALITASKVPERIGQ